jgi:hypothetical protein
MKVAPRRSPDNGWNRRRDPGYKFCQRKRKEEEGFRIRWIITGEPGCDVEPSLDEPAFDVRAVAIAIGSSARIVRALAHAGLLEYQKRASPKARKLFFSALAVKTYVDSCLRDPAFWRLAARHPDWGVFRREKLSVNRRFTNGEFVTKAKAASELGLSVRGLERQINAGKLQVKQIGTRTVVVLRKSLDAFLSQRVKRAEEDLARARREANSAEAKVLRAEKKLKKVLGCGMSQTSPLNEQNPLINFSESGGGLAAG